MTPPPVSVIVVSRHRGEALLRCIEAIRQQDHPVLELVVVADSAGAERVQALGLPVKLAVFDDTNISAARNMGLRLAAGEVVAFVDDDAVPEPTWAGRLAAAFADIEVMQAGGFVRGRNGISYQWRAMAVDATGQDHPLEVPDGISLHRGSAERAIKTQGTNCAFRRGPLMAAGGFDPALRFFLDDADVNLRLGGMTAVVTDAEVQHGVAASVRRRADRVPLCLHDIGASSAVFLRRHAAEQAGAALAALRQGQRRRLLRFVVEGGLEPRDVARLMQTLDHGIAEGQQRALPALTPLVSDGRAFLALSGTGPRAGVVLCGWVWRHRSLARAAHAARAEGRIVSVLTLSPSPRRHWQRFAEGIWWQHGGVHGAADRTDPAIRLWRLMARCVQETRRMARMRPTTAQNAARPSGEGAVSTNETKQGQITPQF